MTDLARLRHDARLIRSSSGGSTAPAWPMPLLRLRGQRFNLTWRVGPHWRTGDRSSVHVPYVIWLVGWGAPQGTNGEVYGVAAPPVWSSVPSSRVVPGRGWSVPSPTFLGTSRAARDEEPSTVRTAPPTVLVAPSVRLFSPVRLARSAADAATLPHVRAPSPEAPVPIARPRPTAAPFRWLRVTREVPSGVNLPAAAEPAGVGAKAMEPRRAVAAAVPSKPGRAASSGTRPESAGPDTAASRTPVPLSLRPPERWLLERAFRGPTDEKRPDPTRRSGAPARSRAASSTTPSRPSAELVARPFASPPFTPAPTRKPPASSVSRHLTVSAVPSGPPAQLGAQPALAPSVLRVPGLPTPPSRPDPAPPAATPGPPAAGAPAVSLPVRVPSTRAGIGSSIPSSASSGGAALPNRVAAGRMTPPATPREAGAGVETPARSRPAGPLWRRPRRPGTGSFAVALPEPAVPRLSRQTGLELASYRLAPGSSPLAEAGATWRIPVARAGGDQQPSAPQRSAPTPRVLAGRVLVFLRPSAPPVAGATDASGTPSRWHAVTPAQKPAGRDAAPSAAPKRATSSAVPSRPTQGALSLRARRFPRSALPSPAPSAPAPSAPTTHAPATTAPLRAGRLQRTSTPPAQPVSGILWRGPPEPSQTSGRHPARVEPSRTRSPSMLRPSRSPLVRLPPETQAARGDGAPFPVAAVALRRIVPVTAPGSLRSLSGRPLVFLRMRTPEVSPDAPGVGMVDPGRKPPVGTLRPDVGVQPSRVSPLTRSVTSLGSTDSRSALSSTPGRASSASSRSGVVRTPGSGKTRGGEAPAPDRQGTTPARLQPAPAGSPSSDPPSVRRVARRAPDGAGASANVARWIVAAPPSARTTETPAVQELEPRSGRASAHPVALRPVEWRKATSFVHAARPGTSAALRSLRGIPQLRFLGTLPAAGGSEPTPPPPGPHPDTSSRREARTQEIAAGRGAPTRQDWRVLASALTELGLRASLVAPVALLAAGGQDLVSEVDDASGTRRTTRRPGGSSAPAHLFRAARFIVARRLGQGHSPVEARALPFLRAHHPASQHLEARRVARASTSFDTPRPAGGALVAVTRWLTAARGPAAISASAGPDTPGAALRAASEPASVGSPRTPVTPPIRGLVRSGLVLATAKGRRAPPTATEAAVPPRERPTEHRAAGSGSPAGARRRWRAAAALDSQGADSRTRWRAPEVPMATEPERAPVPGPAMSNSALGALSENELLSVLRSMASRSPEARGLLQEVREQVEALDRVEKMRRLR